MNPALPNDAAQAASWLDLPLIQPLLPLAVLLAVSPPIYYLFRGAWAELDREAAEARATALNLATRPDYQPAVALVLLAVTLTMHEYYGGHAFFEAVLGATLRRLEAEGHAWLQISTYGHLYGFAWWALTRVLGYLVLPVLIWKACFPSTNLLDFGLRTRGFSKHLGLYALCLSVVLLAMSVVARRPEFLNYYPFYKAAARSWFDFLAWEVLYFLQFFALEFYFRGFLLGVLRKSTGSVAIFAVAVPYCMIHYGKPYLEAHAAIVAGVVLGSLAAKTRSIYAGFLVHIAVAGSMDFLALASRDALPTRLWPQ